MPEKEHLCEKQIIVLGTPEPEPSPEGGRSLSSLFGPALGEQPGQPVPAGRWQTSTKHLPLLSLSL